MAVLHDLAPELVDAILLFIPPRELLDIRLCSRWFNDFISRSSLAQYRIECWAAGVLDDLPPGISYPERLAALRRREEAWHTLDIPKRFDVQVPHLSWRTFELTEGMLSLADPPVTQLQGQEEKVRVEGYSTFMLPTARDGDAASRTWEHNALPDNLVEYAFSVRDLDLAAVLTSKRAPHEAPPVTALPDLNHHIFQHSFDLHLRSVTHADYHPAARKHVVRVCERFLDASTPRSFIQVAGEYVLVMLVPRDLPTLGPDDFDILYAVSWRTGDVHEVAKFPTLQYQSFVFLSVDVLLFCNMQTTALDVFGINWGMEAAATPTLHPSRSLQLPFPGSITAYQGRAEPNVKFPHLGVMADPPRERPFRNDPECALVVFYMYFPAGSCTLIVHRHQILAAAMQGAGLADPMPPIEYKTWGRDICCWINEGNRWITQAQGQRFVSTNTIWDVDEENGGDATVIQVHDFNPHTVRRVLSEVGPDGNMVLPNGNLIRVEGAMPVDIFVDISHTTLETRLPFVTTSLKDIVYYDDLMLDGDTILGIYTPENGQQTQSKIELFALG